MKYAGLLIWPALSADNTNPVPELLRRRKRSIQRTRRPGFAAECLARAEKVRAVLNSIAAACRVHSNPSGRTFPSLLKRESADQRQIKALNGEPLPESTESVCLRDVTQSVEIFKQKSKNSGYTDIAQYQNISNVWNIAYSSKAASFHA